VSFVHSKATDVYVNGVDITTFLSKATSSKMVDKAETSCFGATYKAYVPGLTDAQLTLEGYFDGTASAIDAQLQALLANDTSLFTLLPIGDAASNPGTSFLGWESSYNILSDITAAVKVAMTAESKTGAVPIIIGEPKTTFNAVATTFTPTYDTALAPTTAGGELHYHVFALTGTGSPTVTLSWQTSPDGSAWTTIATSGAISTAPSYGRIVVAPGVTIDVQSRIAIVRGGSTISTTVFAATHRN